MHGKSYQNNEHFMELLNSHGSAKCAFKRRLKKSCDCGYDSFTFTFFFVWCVQVSTVLKCISMPVWTHTPYHLIMFLYMWIQVLVSKMHMVWYVLSVFVWVQCFNFEIWRFHFVYVSYVNVRKLREEGRFGSKIMVENVPWCCTSRNWTNVKS